VSNKVYRSFLPAGHISELPNSPLDYLYKVMPGKKNTAFKSAPLLVTPPVETPPLLPTPSPYSEAIDANYPLERPRKMMDKFLGRNYSGSRLMDNPTNTHIQRSVPQHAYNSYAPPFQPAAAPQPYIYQSQHLPPPIIAPPTYDSEPRPSSNYKSRAQLIVGVDLGNKYTSVAFAFAMNTEAKEDIITEWPGAGKTYHPRVSCDAVCLITEN
jgi:hypothetical protein